MPRLRDALSPSPKKGETAVDPRYRDSLSLLSDDITQYRLRAERLIVYPVKALAGVDVETVKASPAGFMTEHGFSDRSAAVIRQEDDGSWKRFTQREEPALACISSELFNDGRSLRYRTPGGSSVLLDNSFCHHHPGATVLARTYDRETVEGILAPENGNLTGFVRDYLGAECQYTPKDLERIRILLQSSQVTRSVPGTHSGGASAYTAFADVGQLLLINRGTVAFINGGIDGKPVPEDAYRPNIVIDGPANLEDLIASARIHVDRGQTAGLAFGVPSTRCKVTMVDPRTGSLRGDGEPLKALRRMRPLRDNQPTMGINVAVQDACYQVITRDAAIGITAENMADDVGSAGHSA